MDSYRHKVVHNNSQRQEKILQKIKETHLPISHTEIKEHCMNFQANQIAQKLKREQERNEKIKKMNLSTKSYKPLKSKAYYRALDQYKSSKVDKSQENGNRYKLARYKYSSLVKNFY